LKILNMGFADSAGAAFTLSHALNKQGHQAINIKANDDYLNYPTIASIRNYDRAATRRMVQKADVLVFHSLVQPLMQALGLTPEDFEGKKKLLYFHGSDARKFGSQIIERVDKIWGDYQVLVSTPDLLSIMPDAEWLPCARSFKEISSKYGLSKLDQKALDSFKEPFPRIIMGHAPTNQAIKGTHIFLRVITKLIENTENAQYLAIQNQPWDSCLRSMAGMNIFYDQCILGAYGTAAVEASIFKMPVVCTITPDVAEIMERESGVSQPFIQFETEEQLEHISLKLLETPSLRKRFGKGCYEYCKAMHDEKPVADRFLNIVSGMP